MMKYLIIILFTIILSACAHNTSQHQSLNSNTLSVSPALKYNATLDTYVYPYPVQKIKIKSQQQMLNMAYMYLKAPVNSASSQIAARTAVLFHGKNFSGSYWKPIAELLLAQGYNVLMPDQIGFGKSDRPAHYQYSFSTLALNTATLLESLNINNVTVIGHSMGGMLATKFAKIYPSQVEKLILINSIGLEDYLRYSQYKDSNFFYKNELAKTPESLRDYQRTYYYDGKWNERYEQLIAMHIGQMNGEDWPLVAWNNALSYDPIFSEPIVDDFKYITNPVVLINGTRDRSGLGRGFMKEGNSYEIGQYQLLGKKIAAQLQNGKLIELEGLGHMPFIEDWQRFEKVFSPEIK